MGLFDLFKGKKNGFELQGNVSGAIRSDTEMEKINKEEAEEAFKEQKKKLDKYMAEKGFLKYKTKAYVKRSENDVLEYVDLQKDHYGSKTFTVNYALIPLYVKHDFLTYDLGDRLGKLICQKDIWWDYADENTASTSFQNVMHAIDAYLIPWFEQASTTDGTKDVLLQEKKERELYGGRLSDIQSEWFDKIDNHSDCGEVIRENQRTLKLPMKLFE